jgi:hypothetical protein
LISAKFVVADAVLAVDVVDQVDDIEAQLQALQDLFARLLVVHDRPPVVILFQ